MYLASSNREAHIYPTDPDTFRTNNMTRNFQTFGLNKLFFCRVTIDSSGEYDRFLHWKSCFLIHYLKIFHAHIIKKDINDVPMPSVLSQRDARMDKSAISSQFEKFLLKPISFLVNQSFQ